MNQATTILDRRVALERVFNLRDLGGYGTRDGCRVRWRRVYRADGLHQLRGDDLDRVNELGLRAVVDLRTDEEIAERGACRAALLGARYFHAPVLRRTWEPDEHRDPISTPVFLASRYLDMLHEGGTAIVATLRTIADTAGPTVFHCTLGKDRTGVVAAALLSLLGVDLHTIAEDYALSRDAVALMTAWMWRNAPAALDAFTLQPPAFLDAPPIAMQLFLDVVERHYGSLTEVLRDHGLDDALVTELRATLLA